MSQSQDGRDAAVPPVAVEGSCDRRFAQVRDAFWDNFRERGEVGAAVCVMAGGRVAPVPWPDPPPGEAEPAGLEPARLMAYNAYFNPGGLSGAGVVNSPAWRAAELPAANAHGTARGVARVYAALAAGGTLDGTAVADPAALAAATAEQACGQDLVLGRPSHFGRGPFGKLHVRFGKGARTSGPRPRWVPMLDGLDLVLHWFADDVRGKFPDSPVLFADESGGAGPPAPAP